MMPVLSRKLSIRDWRRCKASKVEVDQQEAVKVEMLTAKAPSSVDVEVEAVVNEVQRVEALQEPKPKNVSNLEER